MSKKIEWEQFFVWNKKKFKLKSKLCFLPSITYFPYLKNNIAQFHISQCTVYKCHHPLRGRGDLPKGDVTQKAYLVKWVKREREGSKFQKMGDIIYGWTL